MICCVLLTVRKPASHAGNRGSIPLRSTKSLNHMDLNLLSRFLQELILDYDRISLPGLGSFVVESVPAYFSEDGNTIFPPNKRVSFKREESWDDMLLVNLYMKECNLSKEDAKNGLVDFFKKFEEELKQSKNVEIPNFGKMRSTKEGNYFFVADRRMGIFAEDMGLEPISLKVLNENPDQVFDISEEMSSIVGEVRAEGGEPFDGEVLADIPMVEPIILEEEDPVIMERRKRIIIILSVIIAVLVLIIVFLLFKEPILGLFEGMMYSEEEMEILRQNGLM